MTYSLVSAGTAVDTFGGTFTTGLPAGHATGHLLLWFGLSHGTTNAITVPTGYTELTSKLNGSTKWLILAGKIDGGSETAPSSTFPGTGMTQMSAFSGGPSTITSIVDSSSQTANVSNSNANTSSLTPLTNNCLVLAIAQYRNQSSAQTSPSGFTSVALNSGANADQSLFWSYLVQGNAASVSSSSFAFTGSGSSNCDSTVIALVGNNPGGGGSGGTGTGTSYPPPQKRKYTYYNYYYPR